MNNKKYYHKLDINSKAILYLQYKKELLLINKSIIN